YPTGSAGPVGAARVRLNVYRADELIHTQTSGNIPVAGGGPVIREDYWRSANFVLPTQVTSGGEVRIEAAIQSAGAPANGFANALTATTTANFRNAPNWPQPFPILHARICELNGQGALDCGASTLSASGFKLFEQVAPLPQTGPIYTTTYPAGDTRANFLRLFRLRNLVEAQLPPSAWPAQYVAVDASANRDSQVITDPIFAAGNKKLAFVSGPNALRTLIPCAIASNIGAAGNNPALIIGSPGLRPTLDGLFDPNTANLVRCNTAAATESWVSPEAATSLFNAYSTASAVPQPGTEAIEYIVVSGILRTDGTVAIDPIYRTWTANPVPASASRSNFCFQFNTGTGSAGPDYCIPEPQPVGELNGDAPFAVRLALPPNTARITIARANGSQELAAIVRSPNAPTLQLNVPAATSERNVRVSWSAGDADNDALTFQVWASPDEGGTWIPVAVDLSAPEYTIDTALFPTASTLQIQVRASDGVNDAVQISPQSIALNAAASAAAIATPVRAGDLRIGEGRVVAIPVVNNGSGTLRINEVESSIPGIRYAGASLPVTIAAGSTGEVPLLVTGSEAGSLSANVVLRTNDPAKPSISVPVEATVYRQTGPVASLGAAFVDFGAVAIGAGAERPLQIVNRGTQPLSITNIGVSNTAGIRLTSATSVAGIAPGASTEIVVRCSPANGAYVAGSLTFNTNDLAQPAVSVPLACEGTSPVLEVPGAIVEFGTVASGQTRTQQITIRNVSSATITVTNAVFTNSQFRLLNPRPPFTVPVGSTSTLDVLFAPTVGGIATSTLTLSTDQPNVAPHFFMSRPPTGSTQTNGRLTVDPGQLTFGEVILNQSKTLILNLRNTGSGLLTVTSLASNNPVFQVQGVTLPLTIPIGATVEAQVVFSPSAATAHNSILTVSSDSTSGSDILVAMSGVGLPIPATNVSNFNGMLRQDWTARGTFVSYGPDEAIFRIVRYDNTGLQVSDTGLTIPPGSQLLPSLDSGSGWTQVRISKGTVDGYIQFLGQQNQTFDIVPLRNTLATRYVVTGLERGSDILINNLVSDTNNLVLELRGNNGAIVGGSAQTMTLQSRSSLVQKLEQLFPAAPQGFQGYLAITASQPIQATRTNHGLNSMEASPGQPAPQVSTRQTTIHTPYLRAGNGWNARLQIVNPTEREAKVAIRAASSTGQSVGGSPIEVTIPAGQAYWREYTQIFDLDGNITWNATLSVESNISGIVAEVSYGSSFARGAFALTELASKSQTIPSNTAATTFYILNPNSSPASVDLRNLQDDGNYGTGRRVSIPPRGYYGAPSGLTQAPALRLDSDLPVIAFAAVSGDNNIADFGILPGYSLDGGSTVTPGTSPRLQVDPVS
ncbi:MAG: choice-of-anchor D domain-containing protein, partial [Acidobacteria bacterium]|nr:choice-of-anchor D domain-containing protein [Acidobacteriota bacterium]